MYRKNAYPLFGKQVRCTAPWALLCMTRIYVGLLCRWCLIFYTEQFQGEDRQRQPVIFHAEQFPGEDRQRQPEEERCLIINNDDGMGLCYCHVS